MSFFDAILLFLLAWSVITAFMRGFLREIFSLAGCIFGILLASWYYTRVSVFFSRWIASIPLAHIVAFLLIVILVTILFGLIGKLLQRTASAIGLGIVDRLLGALFGLARGCLLAVALMMAMAAFFPNAPWLAQSALAPYLLRGAHAVSLVVPGDFRLQIRTGAHRIIQSGNNHSGNNADSPNSPESPTEQ